MKIMRAAQDAEFEKLVVAGEPLSKKEQKKLEKKENKQTSKAITQKTQEEYRRTLGEIPSEE